MQRRLFLNRTARLAALGASGVGALAVSGCSSPKVGDYATQVPVLDMRQYFNGTIDAYGVFTDRSGAVVKRFTVVMTCSWSGPAGQEEGVLDEDFTYSDGTKQRRIWRLQRQGGTGPAKYVGRADDVVGQALGEEAGNAFYWHYTLNLPVDGRVIEVQFEDWMYLMNERVMLNKATMSKFGVKLGEVTLAFTKRI